MKARVSTMVLQLGDPRLRQIAQKVFDPGDPAFIAETKTLKAALIDFRNRYGFGRAIAAPQLGIGKRLIAMDLGDGPQLIINPEIDYRSAATFTLWDDCMSFPELLVRVRRHESISLRFIDDAGQERHWTHLGRALSELLQHEIDHLDGVLALDHAIDRDAVVSREAFAVQPEYFRSQVDHPAPPSR